MLALSPCECMGFTCHQIHSVQYKKEQLYIEMEDRKLLNVNETLRPSAYQFKTLSKVDQG
ncbi:Uncharacterized protein DAT39_013342 [Clarias magur]|uniref:Uncharacterized protein n=1 Tax=Clarias magur TaxID=1594786 RepID=A0A8J4WYG5_CLAMG|nr:Uncharacterized protein DAT39_013342 [Clarias magur]